MNPIIEHSIQILNKIDIFTLNCKYRFKSQTIIMIVLMNKLKCTYYKEGENIRFHVCIFIL